MSSLNTYDNGANLLQTDLFCRIFRFFFVFNLDIMTTSEISKQKMQNTKKRTSHARSSENVQVHDCTKNRLRIYALALAQFAQNFDRIQQNVFLDFYLSLCKTTTPCSKNKEPEARMIYCTAVVLLLVGYIFVVGRRLELAELLVVGLLCLPPPTDAFARCVRAAARDVHGEALRHGVRGRGGGGGYILSSSRTLHDPVASRGVFF